MKPIDSRLRLLLQSLVAMIVIWVISVFFFGTLAICAIFDGRHLDCIKYVILVWFGMFCIKMIHDNAMKDRTHGKEH